MSITEIKPIRQKWKGTMTDRERFNNQMHYRSIDRCFNMEFGYWKENFKEWNLFLDNNITNNQQADVFFSFDCIGSIGGKTWMLPPFENKVIEETETTKIFINSDGLLAEVPKDSHDTIPHFIKSSITTPEDWKAVKEERLNRKDTSRVFTPEQIAEMKKRNPPDRSFPLGIHCGSMIGKIRDMLTFEGIAYAAYDYPDMIEDMVETCCLLVEDSLDQLLPHFDFDYASGWEDICFKSGPIVSRDLFKEIVAPRYKRINKRLKEHGIDVWYTDCDGDVRPLLPTFIECGINCLFPYEVNSCVHPAELLEEYGRSLRIMGGVDKMKLIEGKEATKKYLESLVKIVDRGGYIPFCDHRCPPDVKPETYLYYLDLKEKMFGVTL